MGQQVGWESGGRVHFQLGREMMANDYQTNDYSSIRVLGELTRGRESFSRQL